MKTEYTPAETAEMIVCALESNGVAPDAEHTAAPGADWGRVAGWWISDRQDIAAVKHGDNARTTYALSDNLSDLAAWLLTDDADADDAAAVANARDEAPHEIADDYAGACRIIRRRDYYGPTSEYGWLIGDDGEPWQGTADEARAWIEQDEAGPYETRDNESGRPTYYIVPA